MKKVVSMAVLALFAGQAMASELDPVNRVSIPDGLVVKIGKDGKREVFKIPAINGVVDNDQAAKDALELNLKNENKVQNVTPASELDQVTSQESWHWRHGFSIVLGSRYSHYTYTYNCNRSYYSYYPSYSYYSGGYQYNYYYSPVSYGYYRGSRWSDPVGYHYGSRYGWHNRYYP